MAVESVSADNVLHLLRQLSPRERLHVVAEVLPELEDDLSFAPMGTDFWRGYAIETLAAQQGVLPADDFDRLLTGWPEDKTIDDFVQTVREWRRSNPAEADSE